MGASHSMVSLTRIFDVHSNGLLVDTSPGDFYRVLGDLQSPLWDKTVRDSAPAPAVNRTGRFENYKEFDRPKYTEAWQWFDVDLMCLAAYGRLHQQLMPAELAHIVGKWTGMTGSMAAFNNQHGTDIGNNYPAGKTDRGEDPLFDPFICAGTRVQVLEIREGMARLNAFRSQEDPPAPILSDPRVVYAKTIREDGSIGNFGHLGGLPVPYAYKSSHDSWFPMVGLI